MTKRFGFTLAEVLITLGIIGVVAAMTMPTLMNQTNGAQYKAAYKKALSAIAQGITLNVALDGGSFADAVASSASDTATAGSVANILNSRMNIVKTAATVGYTSTSTLGFTEAASGNTTLFFNDGSVFSFPNDSAGCTQTAAQASDNNECYGFLDVNGLKGPNKMVRCDDGTTNSSSCTVAQPTDIYPVVFHDQTILPNSEAAKAVLYGK